MIANIKRRGKLKVKLSVECRRLTTKTTYIDDDLRNSGDLGDLGKYSVCSYTFHNLESAGKTLCVEGSDHMEHGRVSSYVYNTSEDAKLARKAFQTIIRKINCSL